MRRFIYALAVFYGANIINGCGPDAENEFFAIGPAGQPIKHISQEEPSWCMAACAAMLIEYHGMAPMSQADIMFLADFNNSNYLSFNELQYFFLSSYGIYLFKYEYSHEGPVTPEIANNYAYGLAICNIQGAAPIVPLDNTHGVIVAGYFCIESVTSLLIADPAMPANVNRDKFIHMENYRFAQSAFTPKENRFKLLSDSVDVLIFNQVNKSEQLIDKISHFAESNVPSNPRYSEYTDRMLNPDLLVWNAGGRREGDIPDSIMEIYSKATQALLLRVHQNLHTNQYIRDRYNTLFDNVYYGTPIYSSNENVWNPPIADKNVFMKSSMAPSIYSVIVPIYSYDTWDIVGHVALKYGDLDSCLGLFAIPPKNYADKALCKPFLDVEELESIYESVTPFVSMATAGVTGSLPLEDLPNYMVIDGTTNDTIFISPFGDELAYDPATGYAYFTMNKINIPTAQQSENNARSGIRPDIFDLNQNYPNPFNPSTEISYSMKKTGHVKIEILNILGQEVETLVNEDKGAGNFRIKWDASSYASGIYFCRMCCDGVAKTRKMVLTK